MLKHMNYCVDWTQKYANKSRNVSLWTVSVVYILGWVRDTQLCWCWQAYTHCVTAWMPTCPLSVERLDTASPVNFLFKSFISSISNCLSIVEKHFAQTCGSITIADLLTFCQMSVFNGKTHKLQTWKYDVSMTSPVAKKYLTFPLVEYLFPPKHSLKIVWKSKHLPQRYKNKKSECINIFILHHQTHWSKSTAWEVLHDQGIQLVALSSAAVCIIQSTMSRRTVHCTGLSADETAAQTRPANINHKVHQNTVHTSTNPIRNTATFCMILIRTH